MNQRLSVPGSTNFIEFPRVLALVLLLVFLTPVDAVAHCDGKHTGNHPHCGGKEPPPPVVCEDDFPGFLYFVRPTRRSPGEIRLASTDGCRTELVQVESPDGRGYRKSFHMTADRSKGVILTQEEPGNKGQTVVYRQDFTVENRDLSLGRRIPILPRNGEEVPAGDYLYFFSMDIWGDATHDSLYLMTTRLHVFGPGPEDVIEELLIYDLNDMTDVREIYRSAQAAGEWTCPDPDVAFYPQFVPTCYRPQTIRFNPSGTRLYIEDNIDDTQGQRWDATLRIHIDRINAETGGVADLADWEFSAPELVYTGGPSGNLARPDMLDPSILPSQEFIAIRYGDIGVLLDADQCATDTDYADYADGSVLLDSNLWQECQDPETITILSSYLHEGGDSWQSPDALLFSRLVKRHYDIYQRYITGEFAGTEQLLIENGRGADTGQ